MTVQTLLGSMTQKELCHWIAFHKIENEKYAETSPSKDGPTSQKAKDGAMVSQLLALAGENR